MESVARAASWILIALALSLAGCAGMAEYPLGIPSSSTPKFYASMEAVGHAHGFMVIHNDGSLNMKTKEGDWLQYMQRNGSIVLVVIANTGGLDDAGIAARKDKLKALSDDLVKEASEGAREASAFD